jgi:uncharacterized protein (UPF0332 family)
MATRTQQSRFQPPVPVHWQDLVTAARHSLTPVPPATTATRAAAHRAVSTAYYAVFHALKESNASAIVNQPTSQFTADQWTKIYREGNHSRIRDRLYNNRQQMSNNSAYFATEYRSLHNARIQADYNPRVAYTDQDATTWIDRAEAAIQTFLQLPQDERGAIAALTILGNR